MSGAAGMDLRYPIGGLFTVLGVILAGYGFATRGDVQLYAPSGNLNINLLWGVVMLVFGLLFRVLAAVAGRREASDAAGAGREDRGGARGRDH